MRLVPIVVTAAIAVAIVALVGMTQTDLGPWYHALRKPDWAPPDAAYGAAWTAIFALNVVGIVTGWQAIRGRREQDWLIALFALNGFLNICWSLVFFRLQRPDWALFELLALWVSILALILFIWRRSMVGAVLLLPYLGWVTFAGYLNMIIVKLNGPFS